MGNAPFAEWLRKVLVGRVFVFALLVAWALLVVVTHVEVLRDTIGVGGLAFLSEHHRVVTTALHLATVFLLWTLVLNLSHKHTIKRTGDIRQRAAEAVAHFVALFHCVFLLWVCFYGFQLFLAIDGVLVQRSYSHFVLHALNNLQWVLVLLAYFVIAEESLDEEAKRHKLRHHLVWPPFLVVTLVHVLVLAFAREGSAWYQLVPVVGGIANGLAIGLLVGRLDSKLLSPSRWTIMLLYLYAAVQPLLAVVGGEPVHSLLLMVALLMKVVLFLFVAWAVGQRRLEYYMVQVLHLIRMNEATFEKYLAGGVATATAPVAPPVKRTLVFVASPMAAHDDDFVVHNEEVKRVCAMLRDEVGCPEVYYAGETMKDSTDFSSTFGGLDQDFGKLADAAVLLLIYPEKSVSSVLVEAGYAIAEGIPSVYFVKNPQDLPFVLRGAPQSTLASAQIVEYNGYAQLRRLLSEERTSLLPESVLAVATPRPDPPPTPPQADATRRRTDPEHGTAAVRTPASRADEGGEDTIDEGGPEAAGARRASSNVLERWEAALWRYINRQKPIPTALTMLAVGLTFVVLSSPLGLNSLEQPPYQGRHVGFIHAVNWSVVYTFFAPIFLFIVLSGRDELVKVLDDLGGGARRTWQEHRAHTFKTWCVFAVLWALGSLGLWLHDSAMPLATHSLPVERDWTVALAESGSASARFANAAFSLAAFGLQIFLGFAAITFLLSVAAFLQAVRASPKGQLFSSNDARLFQPMLRRILLAGATLYAILYLASLWKLFLHSGETGLFDFLFSTPTSWLPTTGTVAPFVLAVVASLVLLLCIALPFAIAVHLRRKGEAFRSAWPLQWPSPTVLIGIGLVGFFSIVVYWIAAGAILTMAAILAHRAFSRLRTSVRERRVSAAEEGRGARSAVPSLPWWAGALTAAAIAMILTVIGAYLDARGRIVIVVGALAFLVYAYFKFRRRYYRMAAGLLGTVAAANGLPKFAAALDVDFGRGDAWAEFANDGPGLEFTIGGLLLTALLVVLDYRSDRDAEEVKTTKGALWSFTAILFVLLLGFVITAFFVQPSLTPDQRTTMAFVTALVGGLAVGFLGGSAMVQAKWGTPGTRVTLSATGGVAVFVLLLFNPLYVDRAMETGEGARGRPGPDAGAVWAPSPPPAGERDLNRRNREANVGDRG